MAVYRRKNTKSKRYYFKFTIDGITYKETVKSARTKTQAEEAERQARADVHDGTYGTRGKNQLFSTFVNEVYLKWAKQHHKMYGHTERYASVLCEFFKDRTLKQISQLSVESFKRERAKSVTKFGTLRKPRSVNCELTTLSGILGMAIEHKLIKENPCAKVKRLEAEETPIRRLDPGEEESLLINSKELLRPIIRLALWTGFRQCELIALKKGAIDFARNRIFVVNPKYKRDKRKTEGVPMGKDVRELLLSLCREAKGEYVFTNTDGRPLTRHVVQGLFRRACVKAEITGFRFHDLRHEYGSRLGDRDVNLKKIALLMGHSTTKHTEGYVHPDEAGLISATEIAAESSRIVPTNLRQARAK